MARQLITSKTVGFLLDCLKRGTNNKISTINVKIGRNTRQQCLICMCLCLSDGRCDCETNRGGKR